MEIHGVDKNIANVLATGSTGNCEIYHRTIAIDMGVPWSVIKPYLFDLQIILLSHCHTDHFNISTIKRLASQRPTLRFACGEWMLPLLYGIKNVDVLDLNKWYDYGQFKISIGHSYHDVPNCFFRIEKNGYKIFRATDTAHLIGVEAKEYQLYCLESNYNEETVFESISRIENRGEYAYQRGAVNSHLSEQQAREFIFKNKGDNYSIVRLHEHSIV